MRYSRLNLRFHLTCLSLFLLFLILWNQPISAAEPFDHQFMARVHPQHMTHDVNGEKLLQFTAGGHVLGFKKQEIVIAAADHALRIEFVGSQPILPVAGDNVPVMKSHSGSAAPLNIVTYPDLWRGVDLVYERTGQGFAKSTYYVAPGADPSQIDRIRLRYNVPVTKSKNGSLLLAFNTGQLRESPPIAWQDVNGRRQPVNVAFKVLGHNQVGFEVGEYDASHALVIDPTMEWITFMGSTSDDEIEGVAVDENGIVYVCGTSSDAWGSSPARPYTGGLDVFVAKYDQTGNLTGHTFLGGAGDDDAYDIAIDPSGNVVVTGTSTVAWGSDPVHAFAGGYEGFVAKLDAGSGDIMWHTFMGSGGVDSIDIIQGIAVDAGGNIFLAGHSREQWGEPLNPHAGNSDVFAAKLDTNGALLWNTFMGSVSEDYSESIALDSAGYVYIAGRSALSWGTSPLNAYSGGTEGFIAKLDTNGSFLWNTFVGSSATDYIEDIFLDDSNSVYICGSSNASWGAPLTLNPHAGDYDGFVAKFSSNGFLLWNTFLGSALSDSVNSITVDALGNIYALGRSYDNWGDPLNSHHGPGVLDAFVASMTREGELLWHAYLGSATVDIASEVAIGPFGGVYVTGKSDAQWDYPVDPHSAGENYDGFLTKLIGRWNFDAVDRLNDFFAKPVSSSRSIVLNGDGYPHVIFGGSDVYHTWFDGAAWQSERIDQRDSEYHFASIAIDNNTGDIQIAYYDALAGDLKWATNESGEWDNDVIDATGNVGSGACIALDSNGTAHISYYDLDNNTLKYISGTKGNWNAQTIDSNSGGTGEIVTAIAVDGSDNVHISYYDAANTGLKYATNTSGTFVTTLVDEDVDGTVGMYSSIAVDTSGIIHIAYYDFTKANLKCASFNGEWTYDTVDATLGVGSYPSIAIDSGLMPHITYYDAVNKNLKHIYETALAGWATPETVDSVDDVGTYGSMVIGSGDTLHISYFDQTNIDLKYISGVYGDWPSGAVVYSSRAVGSYNAIALDPGDGVRMSYVDTTTNTLKYADNTSESWSVDVVDSTSSVGPDTTSIAVDGDGLPHISYVDQASDTLKHAWRSGGPWTIEDVDSDSLAFNHTSIAIASDYSAHISYHVPGTGPGAGLRYAKGVISDINYSWSHELVDADAGQWNALAIDGSDVVHMSYINASGQALKHAYGSSGAWTIETITTGANTLEWNDIAVDSTGVAHVSFYDSTDGDLKYATNAGGSWAVTDIESTGEVGKGNRITCDAADNPHIVYPFIDSIAGIKYGVRVAGTWIIETVISGDEAGGEFYGDIAVDSTGIVHLSVLNAVREDLYHVYTESNKDRDFDGMDDVWEIDNFDTLDHDGTGDGDHDILNDLQEYLNSADPNIWDTDSDGFGDGVEVLSGSNPASPSSVPLIVPGTYYVDVNAAGGGDGTSTNPWRSLYNALVVIQAGPAGAYTLNVASGVYSVGNGEPDVPNAWGAFLIIHRDNITIQGAPGAIIDGTGAASYSSGLHIEASNVTISGFEIRNFEFEGIFIWPSDNSMITGCHIHHVLSGIYISGGTNSTITGCNIHNASQGINIFTGSGSIVEGCRIYDNTGAEGPGVGIHIEGSSPVIRKNMIYSNSKGIYIYADDESSHSPSIINNLIYDIASVMTSGIEIIEGGATLSPDVYHNTIIGGNGSFDGIYISGASAVPDIKFNIITSFGQYGINNNGGNPVVDYNDFWNNSLNAYNGVTPGTHNVDLDPKFSGGMDYHLQVTSPCIDAIPLDAGDTVAVDLDGNTRPRGLGYDMGAYESPEPAEPPANNPPAPPTAEGPADESTFDETDTITLDGSSYNDPEGDLHVKTYWQVWRADSGEIVYQTVSEKDLDHDLEELTLPETLAPGLKYEWQIGYEDAAGKTSWSAIYSFKVGTSVPETLPEIAAGKTLLDFGMISIVHWPDDPSPEKVFNIEYDPRYYRIGTYDPVLGKYIEFDDGLSIEPGRAYWMLAREGISVNFSGIPVSQVHDIEVRLHHNDSETAPDGWNMIAPPNDADYLWGDVWVGFWNEEIGEYEAVEISTLENDEIIDRRVWVWQDGTYVSHMNDTDFVLESYKGYWVKAVNTSAYLVFPEDAQTTLSQASSAVASSNAREAMAEDQDTPPMPMGALADNDTENIFGGCFVEILSP